MWTNLQMAPKWGNSSQQGESQSSGGSWQAGIINRNKEDLF